MTRQLKLQDLRQRSAVTHEGAQAYDHRASAPLLHLTFNHGSALLTDAYYETEQAQVRGLAEALLAAARVEPRFPWQYGAWMRDPAGGKGNRVQGSLVPALLDGLLDETEATERYVARCLGHRPDDVTAFLAHFARLGLGRPSAAARRGMARALAGFDEYQLTKYAQPGADVRLCDAILCVQEELAALGSSGRLALELGRYLHAPSRARGAALEASGALRLTRARRALFKQPREYVFDPAFREHVATARVTWEQVLGQYGARLKDREGALLREARRRSKAAWKAILATPGLLPDMALLRNLRNLSQAGFSKQALRGLIVGRRFKGVWPHQVQAGFRAVPGLGEVFEAVMERLVPALPAGRHMGIADASGSMSARVGGLKSSTTAMDVALCLTGLMGLTSDLGASFSDGSWGPGGYLKIAERRPGEGALAFSQRPELRSQMGGTQVFGAVLELIAWLKRHDHITPPDCLWFFSDMQFHPATGALRSLPKALLKATGADRVNSAAPPLETALRLYREQLGPVDVVLWNLAAYGPAPVPLDMEGVLMVSGFDANTFKLVEAWRQGSAAGADREASLTGGTAEQNQRVILEQIRSY